MQPEAIELVLLVGRWLFLGLLTLFVWQVYHTVGADLRSVPVDTPPAQPREWQLVAQAGTGDAAPGRAYLLRGELSIGRADDNELVLQDTFASQHHARLGVEHAGGADRVWVMDLGSTNGTLVDGQSLPAQARRPLRAGSLIQIGDTVLTVQRG